MPKGKAPKVDTYAHPTRDEVEEKLAQARFKFLTLSSLPFVERSAVANFFYRLIQDKVIVDRDLSNANPDLSRLHETFTPQRQKEVLKYAIEYVFKCWLSSHRLAAEREEMCDRALWPNRLGIPPCIMELPGIWEMCQDIDVYENAILPSILGPVELHEIYDRVDRKPPADEVHLRLECWYRQERLMHHHEVDGRRINFLPSCQSKDESVRLNWSNLRKKFHHHTYKMNEPAGGRWQHYSADTGMPVKRYLEITKNGQKQWWVHYINAPTQAKMTTPEFQMNVAECHLFSDARARAPTSREKREFLQISQREKADEEAQTGQSHSQDQARFAMPHGGRLSDREMLVQMPSIDVDEEMDRIKRICDQIKHGSEEGAMGGVDLDYRGQVARRQRMADEAAAKRI